VLGAQFYPELGSFCTLYQARLTKTAEENHLSLTEEQINEFIEIYSGDEDESMNSTFKKAMEAVAMNPQPFMSLEKVVEIMLGFVPKEFYQFAIVASAEGPGLATTLLEKDTVISALRRGITLREPTLFRPKGSNKMSANETLQMFNDVDLKELRDIQAEPAEEILDMWLRSHGVVLPETVPTADPWRGTVQSNKKYDALSPAARKAMRDTVSELVDKARIAYLGPGASVKEALYVLAPPEKGDNAMSLFARRVGGAAGALQPAAYEALKALGNVRAVGDQANLPRAAVSVVKLDDFQAAIASLRAGKAVKGSVLKMSGSLVPVKTATPRVAGPPTKKETVIDDAIEFVMLNKKGMRLRDQILEGKANRKQREEFIEQRTRFSSVSKRPPEELAQLKLADDKRKQDLAKHKALQETAATRVSKGKQEVKPKVKSGT
jgi:hypothetical protein